MDPALRGELAQLRRALDAIDARLRILEQSSRALPDGASSVPVEESRSAPDRETSLESRIGSQWLNRVGIIAVLFGVAYFLKLAFENNWIGPPVRIAIGLATGVALFVWSERFRRTGSTSFSHTLKAIALGTMYLSLWASFDLYHLVPAAVAFAAMFVVSASTFAISLRQNAQIIAAMALFGGLASPALVSTGENHETFLFSYLAVLGATAGMLSIKRRWYPLALAALIGTTAYYAEWNWRFYHTDAAFGKTLFFVLLFFAIFLATADLSPGSQTGRARLWPAVILAVNAVFSFAEIYDLFSDANHRWFQPWMILLLAAVYLIASRFVRWTALRLLNIAIALGLITVAIALKLHSHFITLGWLIESGVLLCIGIRNRQRLFQIGGIVVLVLAVVRLLVIDDFHPALPFWNMRALLFLIAIATTGTLAHYARVSRASHAEEMAWYISSVAVTLLTLYGLDREISLALYPGPDAPEEARRRSELTLNFARSALWMTYGAAAMALGFLRRISFYRYLALALLAITVCKVFAYDIVELDPAYRVVSFIALGIILLAVSYAYQKDWLKTLRAAEVKD